MTHQFRFSKRSWPVIGVGVVLCLGVIGLLLWYTITGMGRRAFSPGPTSGQNSTSTEPVVAQPVPRLLDGVIVSPEVAALPVFGIMVENSLDARPLSGPAKANVVIEAPVEGGITRFLLFFDASSTVDQIGPVRSARPYYVDWADALGAAYVHVGGSPEALSKIRLPGFKNLDEFANAKYFWRSAKRLAPHNAFTRMDLLVDAFQARSWRAGTFSAWHYVPAATSTQAGNGQFLKIPYGGAYHVTWKYDAATNLYTRYQAGIEQKDADGTPVKVSNVIMLRSDARVLDNEGRLRLRTTGSGSGALMRDGQTFDIVWRRSPGEWLRFETTEGADAMLQPGKTWISVVTTSTASPL